MKEHKEGENGGRENKTGDMGSEERAERRKGFTSDVRQACYETLTCLLHLSDRECV